MFLQRKIDWEVVGDPTFRLTGPTSKSGPCPGFRVSRGRSTEPNNKRKSLWNPRAKAAVRSSRSPASFVCEKVVSGFLRERSPDFKSISSPSWPSSLFSQNSAPRVPLACPSPAAAPPRNGVFFRPHTGNAVVPQCVPTVPGQILFVPKGSVILATRGQVWCFCLLSPPP